MIYIPSFVTFGSGINLILTFLPHQCEKLRCWHHCWDGSVKYAIGLVSCDIMCIRSFLAGGSGMGVRVILTLSLQKYHRLQFWHYWRDGFMKYVIGVASGGMIYIQSFIQFGLGVKSCNEGHTCIQKSGLSHTCTLTFWKYEKLAKGTKIVSETDMQIPLYVNACHRSS
jgi:hypothetical protein